MSKNHCPLVRNLVPDQRPQLLFRYFPNKIIVVGGNCVSSTLIAIDSGQLLRILQETFALSDDASVSHSSLLAVSCRSSTCTCSNDGIPIRKWSNGKAANCDEILAFLVFRHVALFFKYQAFGPPCYIYLYDVQTTRHPMSSDAIPCHPMSSHSIPCHRCYPMPSDKIHAIRCRPLHPISSDAIGCHPMPSNATDAIECHPMPSDAMPCHLMPSHAIQCHPIPSHAILCH